VGPRAVAEGCEKFSPTGILSRRTHTTIFNLLNLLAHKPQVCLCVCVCLRTLRLESLCVRLYLKNTSQSRGEREEGGKNMEAGK